MIVGVLLAAGAATRFGGDKLLAELSAGQSVAEAACAGLSPAVDRLIAVVRPGADELAERLAAAGAEITVCAEAGQGMGVSLAHGIAQAPNAAGWLIALADMPLVATADARRVAGALRDGAAIVVPEVAGRSAHPVGFSARFFAELAALSGDQGARALLERHAAVVLRLRLDGSHGRIDVDTVDDLARAREAFLHEGRV
jgi:molybdenum cofactor cytidylyltransferase